MKYKKEREREKTTTDFINIKHLNIVETLHNAENIIYCPQSVPQDGNTPGNMKCVNSMIMIPFIRLSNKKNLLLTLLWLPNRLIS